MVELVLMIGLIFCVILSLITVIINRYMYYEKDFKNYENDFKRLNKRVKELEDEVRDMTSGYNCGGWYD